MFDLITPLILTYNEAPNIGRTLAQLCWAMDIVIVDSFSDDGTVEIANSFSHVRVCQRQFDNHGSQWSFGLRDAGISTDWVLALDADFVLSPELVDEIRLLQPPPQASGYLAPFRYCISGRPLRSGLLKPQVVLFRRSLASYILDGHTQRLLLDGEVVSLDSPILHDDRKPLTRWFTSQQRYMELEAHKLLGDDPASLGRADRIRRWRIVAPLAVLFYCLIVRGGVLDGWPGFFYASQRMLAELLLSLYLIEGDFNAAADRRAGKEQPIESGRQKALSSEH